MLITVDINITTDKGKKVVKQMRKQIISEFLPPPNIKYEDPVWGHSLKIPIDYVFNINDISLYLLFEDDYLDEKKCNDIVGAYKVHGWKLLSEF